MIKIGEFSKLFDVSIKTVRFYEESGLLIPAFVDIYTGYRYYNEENISQMSKILFLKSLGFSIKEIRCLDDNSYSDKIKEYEDKIKSMYKCINILESLSNNEERGNMDMKTFINDEDAIGKWKLIGCAKSKDDYYKNKYFSDEDNEINVKELYLMENGKEYWVISWTKGTIFICDNPCPYEIENDLMFVKIYSPVDKSDFKIAVYEKIDNKRYNIEDFIIKDNIDIDFVSDERIKGIWKSIDLIPNKEMFNSSKKICKEDNLFVDKIIVSPDDDVIVSFSNSVSKNVEYTKNYIINLCNCNTLSQYEIKEVDGKTYMIIEWKSGDYVYAGQINCYYVLEKISFVI